MESPSPKRRHTREDSGLRLDRDGRWWHDGEPIEHPRIIEAFNVGLKPTGDGRYRLEVGGDWCYVEVEDAAYRVTAVDITLDEQLSIRLSDRTSEILDPSSLALDDTGVLTCLVKGGRAKARFLRDTQFALGSLIEPSGETWLLRIGSGSVPLPRGLVGGAGPAHS